MILYIQVGFSQIQHQLEFGFSSGSTKFNGDINGNSPRDKSFNGIKHNLLSRYIGGVYVGYHLIEPITITLSINTGKINGADSLERTLGQQADQRRGRSLLFRSNITELILATEIDPIGMLTNSSNDVEHKLRPYITVGIGLFHFNPQGEYIHPDNSKSWVDLKPLRTEGQGMSSHPDRKEYNLTQFTTPIGLGIKYYFSGSIYITIEYLYRKTFTDYIDDVSTRYIANQDFINHFGAGNSSTAIAIQMANKAAFKNGGVAPPSYDVNSKRGSPLRKDAYSSVSIKIAIMPWGIKKRIKSLQCPI
jgi:hypothetical protein